MRRTIGFLAFSGLFATLGSIAPAQEFQVKTGPTYSVDQNGVLTVRQSKGLYSPSMVYGMNYLNIKEVQQELGMSQEQVARLRELHQRVVEEKHEARQQAGDIEALENNPEALRRLEKTYREVETAAANALLTPEQRKRHRQISLQWWGTGVLQRSEVADELRLTPEQRERIAAIYRGYEEKRNALFEAGWEQSKTATKPAVKLSNAARLRLVQDPTTPYNIMRSEIRAVLTPTQLKQWEAMQGPIYKWLAHSRGTAY